MPPAQGPHADPTVTMPDNSGHADPTRTMPPARGPHADPTLTMGQDGAEHGETIPRARPLPQTGDEFTETLPSTGRQPKNLEQTIESHRHSPSEIAFSQQQTKKHAQARTQEPYDIISTIGRGGMGTVYKARQTSLDRIVAYKVMNPEVAKNPKRRNAFLREARVMKEFEHPNILRIQDVVIQQDGAPAIVMPYVQGGELSDILNPTTETRKELKRKIAQSRKQRDGKEQLYQKMLDFVELDDNERLSKTLSMMVKVSNAVAYAHSRGIVHRDLKPANILVGEFGDVKVMDWGLGKAIGDTTPDDIASNGTATEGITAGTDLTMQGGVMGTPWYMSPEQAHGKAPDPSWDQYAIGCMLYEALTGIKPGENRANVDNVSKQASLMRILDIRKKSIVDRPSQVTDQHIPPELESIVMKTLAKNPRQRYKNVAALAEDIEAYISGRPVNAHQYTWKEKISRGIRRHTTAVAATGISLAFLTLGAFGLSAYQHSEAQRARAQQQAAHESQERAEAEAEAAYQAQRSTESQLLAAEAQEDARRHRSQLYLSRAARAEDHKDYTRAKQLYSEAIEQFPNDPVFYAGRAGIFYDLRRDNSQNLERALADANLALELDPENAQAYHVRGLYRSAKGDYNEAIEDYESAIENGATYVYWQLGDLQEHLGRDRDAIRSYENYISSGHQRYLQDAQNRIRDLGSH